jgi:hypothetical protein
MPREQSERAPKQGFGDSENDKATGSTAIRQPPRRARSIRLRVVPLPRFAAAAVIERAESVLSERANKPEAQARRR